MHCQDALECFGSIRTHARAKHGFEALASGLIYHKEVHDVVCMYPVHFHIKEPFQALLS